jgi:hypothetical protein
VLVGTLGTGRNLALADPITVTDSNGQQAQVTTLVVVTDVEDAAISFCLNVDDGRWPRVLYRQVPGVL